MKNKILRPMITEKNAYRQTESVYVFECASDSTKAEVKYEIESQFNVSVMKINTSITRSRAKKTKYGMGRVSYFKKAFVRLKPGQKIAVFEGV